MMTIAIVGWALVVVLIVLVWLRHRHPRWSLSSWGVPFAVRKWLQLAVVVAGFVVFFCWAAFDKTTVPSSTAGQPAKTRSITEKWKAFSEDYGLYGALVMLAVGVILVMAQDTDEIEKLRRTQKERVRILEGFSPTAETLELFSTRCIYEAIIGSLDRLQRKLGPNDPTLKPDYKVCFLLCSPALDYPDNPKSRDESGRPKWGREFSGRFKDIAGHPRVKTEISYLPVTASLGYNPMDDFLTVLAHYDSGNPEEQFRLLKQQTADIDAEMRKNSRDWEKRFTLRTHMFDIPFQMVLVNGKDTKEVIVSFAGREILESGTKETKGFFSSDPYVVETFQKIYDLYVEEHPRMPVIPGLTKRIVVEHTKKATHQIKDFLNLGIDLEVADGAFSPGIGNSTKFTAWAVTKILSAQHKDILDIGSGTGVLALVAEKTLAALNVEPRRIWAVEEDERAFACLEKNRQGHTVEGKRWKLGAIDGANCMIDVASGKAVDNAEIGTFDVIIADLPFLDVDEEKAKDKRFYDPKHSAHETLLGTIRMTGWLKTGGVLVTSFSSLGGMDDVSRFERMIIDRELQTVQRLDFHESGYLWHVFVIMRKDDFDGETFWWNSLNARKFA